MAGSKAANNIARAACAFVFAAAPRGRSFAFTASKMVPFVRRVLCQRGALRRTPRQPPLFLPAAHRWGLVFAHLG